MAELRQGNREAAGALTELLWPELRRLAAAQMKGERSNHTWQPTALVNELYLELINAKGLGSGGIHRNDKNAFLALAAHMMMRLLIHHARPAAFAGICLGTQSDPYDLAGLDGL